MYGYVKADKDVATAIAASETAAPTAAPTDSLVYHFAQQPIDHEPSGRVHQLDRLSAMQIEISISSDCVSQDRNVPLTFWFSQSPGNGLSWEIIGPIGPSDHSESCLDAVVGDED